MKPLSLVVPLTFAVGVALSGVTMAQAPAGSTGQCKDGSYTSAETKRGACAGHGGVKDWYAQAGKSEEKGAKSAKSEEKPTKAAKSDEKAAKSAKSDEKAAKSAKADEKATKSTKSEEKAAKSSTASTPATAGAAAGTAASTGSMAAASKSAPKGMRAEAAPGGGAGKVWLNTSSNVYHCSGDEWYGKTKSGEYVSEADAKAKGARAARGKGCG